MDVGVGIISNMMRMQCYFKLKKILYRGTTIYNKILYKKNIYNEKIKNKSWRLSQRLFGGPDSQIK
jgi:hypothetical protein